MEVASKLKPLTTNDTIIEYVGIYESTAADQGMQVDITDKSKPVILFLSSYSPVDWRVTNSGNSKIKAVIFNSLEEGSSVTLPNGSTAPIIRMPDLVMAYTPFPSYEVQGHGYYFENVEFGDLRPQILKICGKPLTGFSGPSAGQSITVPDFVMNEANTKLVDDAYAEIARLKAKEPQKPSNLFGKDAAGNEISWASRFNSNPVPVGRFQAYYFNTKNPTAVLGTEMADRASIKYSYSDFLGIDSNDFGAYYVGDFKFDSDTVRNISLAQQYSFTRVLIDGKVVFEETDHNSGMQAYTFKKGVHRIEVEHINDWHGVGFTADFNQLPISDEDAIRAYLNTHISSDTKVYATMIYGSAQRDMSCTVKLPKGIESDFLVLNSYEPVHWIIDTSGSVKIKGVMLSSYYDGSSVSFAGGKTCEVIRADNTYVSPADVDPGVTSISKNSSQYLAISGYLEYFGLKKLDGICVAYEANDFIAGSIKVEPWQDQKK